MNDYFPDYGSAAPRWRRAGHSIGSAAQTALIAVAVILAVGGLAMLGLLVLFVISLNQWGSNK